MPNTEKPWETNHEELPDGRLVCSEHQFVVCYKCGLDFSFMDEVLREDQPPSDDETPLTKEELEAFMAQMKTTKGCECLLPLAGSGCPNCDPHAKGKKGEDTGADVKKTGGESKDRDSKSSKQT